MFYLSIWKLYGFQDKPYSDGLNKGQRLFFLKNQNQNSQNSLESLWKKGFFLLDALLDR